MNMLAVNRMLCWLAGVAVAALSASPASATIFPAATIGGFYQQTTTSISVNPPAEGTCTNVTACFVVFGKVPSGKQLIVTNVSCSLAVSSGDLIFARLAPQLNNGTILLRFQFVQATKAVDTVFTFNNAVLALFNTAQRPLLQVVPSGNATITSVACTIAGQLINTP